MNLADVMDDIATALGTIDGLRVFDHTPDRIVPPAAIILWPETYEYDTAMARGMDRLALPVAVLVGRAHARTSRDLLAAYADGANPPAEITFVGVGAGVDSADSGSGVTLSPALPDDIAEGDLLLCLASVRNTGTGSVDTPSGWTLLGSTNTNNMRLFGKVATGTDSAPSVSFTSGGTNVTALAQCAAFRGASTDLDTIVTASNVQAFGAAQNLPFASLTIPSIYDAGIRCGWKQDDWTSVATVSNFERIGTVTSTAGNDASMIWDWQTDSSGWFGGSWVVTGGAAAQSTALSVALAAGDPPPARSIKAAIESGTYTACDVPRVEAVTFDVLTIAGVEYLAGTFTIDITGTGAA